MNENTAREIIIAAIQVESIPGKLEANHEHAEKFIIEAAEKHAKIILLPELFSCG